MNNREIKERKRINQINHPIRNYIGFQNMIEITTKDCHILKKYFNHIFEYFIALFYFW